MVKKIGLGMNYPIDRGQTGYFDQTFDTFTNEEVKLINLMHTTEGERIMEPAFGLRLERFLFEPITTDITSQIANYIRSKISYWLPNLIINSLNVMSDPQSDADRNVIYVTVNFSLTTNPAQYDETTFKF